ncbi:MAG: hypothetical protein N2512_01190 [Armatimonadetes bacterium]|nr:hypothetical protein [Armatimonadota bacterium]
MTPALGATSEGVVRTRGVVFGALLVPVVTFWVASMENVYGGRPTYLSIFFHAVILLAVLVWLNGLLRLLVPKAAFTRAELILIYAMIGASSGIVGDQFLSILIPSLAYPFRYATDANKWEQILLPYLPGHAVVSDPVAVRNFYEGDTTLYMMANLRPWLTPALLWATFIAFTQLMCLAINVLIRRQWTQYEKLSFPLVVLPMEMTAPGRNSLWRNKLMWIGFGLSAFIDLFNGLSTYWPAFPKIPVKVHWMSFGTRFDAALTTTGIAFYPFVIGTAFLLPADLTFSTWFFLLFFRLQRFFFAALGYPSPYPWQSTGHSVAPAMLEQGIGSYMAVVVFGLWAARRHLAAVWKVVTGGSQAEGQEASTIPPAEMLEYRLAFACLVVGLVFTTGFAATLGMPVSIGFIYMVLYLVICTAIAKIRAEAGAPTHGFHFAGPDHVILTVLGPDRMTRREMAAFGLMFGFNRAYTGIPMPHQLEGMKMGEMLGVNRQQVTRALAVATALGSYAAFWALLHLCFREGVEQMGHPVHDLSPQGWQLVNSWLVNPQGPNWGGLGGIVAGFLFSTFLMAMRFRFVWWQFHPIGYAIAADWTTGLIWMPLMFGWLAKVAVMRYLGPKAYRRALPIALGLMLGEFAVGGFWSVFAVLTRKPQYFFWT